MGDIQEYLPFDMSDLDLSLKEILFVRAMIEHDYDSQKAIIAAKILPLTATAPQAKLEGVKWANKQNVRTAIQRYSNAILDPYRDQLQMRLLESLQARAFYDPAVFYFPDGTSRPLDSIPPEYRRVIEGITEDYKGKDAQVRSVNYKLADRASAMKALQELLKKGDTNEATELPTDAKSRLDAIFSSVTKAAVAAGAKAATDAIKASDDNKNTISVAPEAEIVVPVAHGGRNKNVSLIKKGRIK